MNITLSTELAAVTDDLEINVNQSHYRAGVAQRVPGS